MGNRINDNLEAMAKQIIVKNNQEIMSLTKQRDELLPLLMNIQATVLKKRCTINADLCPAFIVHLLKYCN